ncbi:hypothetical protein E4U42_003975 [Claviceps africana]|uniref:Protein kinase domain-containing protein n=1 Tax=Claviceps africana TaxID=83212 RepID=A0A8K0JC85_9HYPO|nr:hypothetical protein E4U42_003975 [Claviceps africana]
MNMREEMRELLQKPIPGPTTTHRHRQTALTDLQQDQEDVGHSRAAVTAWLTLMETGLCQSRATPSSSNNTTTTAAPSMDHQPKIPRSRLSVMGATPFRTTRRRGNSQEPQQQLFEVSPVTSPSEHLPPLDSASSKTRLASTSTDLGPQPFKSTAGTPRGNDDELSAQSTMTDALVVGADGCTLSNAVAVTANPHPPPVSKDMSAVVLRLRNQPIGKPAGGKRSIRPKIIAVRSPNRPKQPGIGEYISSQPKDAEKVKDKDKRRDKNKRSAPGKSEAYRVHPPPAHANKAASNSQRHHDIKAAAALRLHRLHQLHHQNVLVHPVTSSLLGSTNCPTPLLGPRHRTLKHCLAKHPSGFDEPLVAFLTRQILLGLAHLHRRGVTHRNIRTSTVFVAPDGTCKIGGLHHATHHDDAPNRGRYSPRLAPETLVLQESTATSKLDIWDLGILVLEMLGPSGGRWCKHDVIRALLLEPMDGGILLLEKVDGEKMGVDARLFLMDCLQV